MSADTYDQPPEVEAMNARIAAQVEEEQLARQGLLPDLGALKVTLPPAPGTPAARLSKVAQPVMVTREFFTNVVNACWLLSLRGERVDPPAVMRVAPGVFRADQLDLLGQVLASEKMRLALLNRGIEPGRTTADGLSQEMMACIRALTDPTPGLTLKQRLRGAGVTWDQYQGWLGFAPFRDALTRSSERDLKGSVPLANAALIAKATDERDLKSIQYLHELTGYFTPGAKQNLDAMQMIRELITLVLRSFTDRDELTRFASAVQGLQIEWAAGARAAGSGGSSEALVTPYGQDEVQLEIEDFPAAP